MTPDEIAQAAAAVLWAGDAASKALGIAVLEVGSGRATLSMAVRADMLNGIGTAHGGLIFSLADSAFAYACNSGGVMTVAAQCAITFLRPARLGDVLVARARNISEGGRSGLTDVTVDVDGVVVAEFRGYSRSIGRSLLGGEGADHA